MTKELKVSIPMVCGVLSTVGVGLILRRALPLKHPAVTGEEAFVMFTIYGLAFSLMSSASTVMRRRDTIILILAATIVWGVFAKQRPFGMVRYLVFSTLTTVGVLLARRSSATMAPALRIARGAAVPAVLCGIGGLLYHGLVLLAVPASAHPAPSIAGGFFWGLSLGLAVGLGVAIGLEVVTWLVKKIE